MIAQTIAAVVWTIVALGVLGLTVDYLTRGER